MISIEVKGIPEVQKMLLSVASPAVRQEVLKAVGEFAQGQMRKYPDYTYVSRTEAYGKPFQSARQRRWFFAALRSGELKIPYPRTGTLQRGWKLEPRGSEEMAIRNTTPYGRFVQNSPQARMMTLRQWRSLQTMLMQEKAQIQRVMQDAWNRALKRLGR
jgi:hypothetical protein